MNISSEMDTWTDENLGITSNCIFLLCLNKQGSDITHLEDRGCWHDKQILFMSRRIPQEDDEEYKIDIYMICSFFIPVCLHCLVLHCGLTVLMASLWLAAQPHQAQAKQKPVHIIGSEPLKGNLEAVLFEIKVWEQHKMQLVLLSQYLLM